MVATKTKDNTVKAPRGKATAKKAPPSAAGRSGKGSGNGHLNDGAEAIAKSSGGKINTAQVRILLALRAGSSRVGMSRLEIKEAVGMGHKKGYHVTWVRSLRNLVDRGLITAKDRTDATSDRVVPAYHITAEGRKIITDAERVLAKTETAV